MATPATPDQQRLLLTAREAAQALGVSERQLWQHTSPRGPIACVKIGACVRYSPEALQQFIRQATTDECMHPPGRTCGRCQQLREGGDA